MTFLSGTFFVFLFIIFILYFITPIRFRWMILLVSSVVFYLFSGVPQILFIVLSSLLVYGTARWMDTVYARQDWEIKEGSLTREEKKARRFSDRKRCRRMLNVAVFFLVLVLTYCKIGNWVIGSLRQALGEGAVDWMQVIVPLGISYYTFSLISYLADVYWRKEKAEQNYLKFLLFVIYFPKILQGPISRHKNLADQLIEGHTFEYKRVCYGLQLALWGYFKKLVIADRLAVFVNEVFGNYMAYSGLIFVVAILLASVQLYADFSGCMDIASGISQIFGIELEKNFDHPFFARSAAEFWRRWHITLGTWFKDYVYMPLVVSPRVSKMAQQVKKIFGARVGKAVMTIIPTGIVWVLTGLWHGTGYNYIAWGLYWGGIIIFSTVFAPEIRKLTGFLRINTETGGWKVFQMVRTFLLFSIGRLITVPGHLRTTLDVLEKIGAQFDIWILFDGSLYNYGLNQKNFILAMITLFILWAVSMLQERGSLRDRIAGQNIAIRWAIYYLAFFSVLIFGMYGAGFNNAVFAYMQY